MKKLYLILLISIPLFTTAQEEKTQQFDSLTYYRNKLYSLWKEAVDSLHNTQVYKETQAAFKRHLQKSNDYTAFMLFFDLFHSEYGQFNKMIAPDGFNPVNDIGGRIGFGASVKTGRAIVDMAFVVGGLSNKTKKGLEEIKTSFSSFAQYDVGYDLLNKSWISLYPYGGLSLRISNIQYEKKATWNPEYNSIVDIVSDKKELNLTSIRAGFQLGIGFDLTLFQNRDKTLRRILFVKAGINRPLWKDKYHYAGVPNYNPGIKQGDWIITIGFKFAHKD